MKQLLKYLISVIIIILPFSSIAQDSLDVVQSKVEMHISADYGKGIESIINKQSKWEFGIGILFFQQYNFIAEYGYGNLNPENVINNGSYTSKGNYFRVGMEYVFTIKPKRYLSTGLLYASSNFTDNGNVSIESDLWANLDENFTRSGLTANWLEWIVTTEAPLLKVETGFLSNFYWGTRFRLRFLSSDLTQPNFDIYAIPGFGKTYSNLVPAVNLYLKYRISF